MFVASLNIFIVVQDYDSCPLIIGFWPVPSEISENDEADIFWIFCVKTTNLTNVKHYSLILSDFLNFGTIFSIFKNLLDLEHFWKTQCSEIVCAFVWHPNTLKLNSIMKNTSNFMKFITKIKKKYIYFFWVFNCYWHFWIIQPGPNLNPLATYIVYFINLGIIFFQKHLRIGRFKQQFRFWDF